MNNNNVNYIYDGAQAIAEVSNGAVSAAILTGLNIDEVLARYSQSGNRTYLTDALGSVIAQANDTQAIENYYAYTPYGETTALGPDGGNPIQYTARENDGTGLYYYRARYYDSILKIFTSEDPIGLAGGLNSYRYVEGNPVSNADPSGTAIPLLIAAGSAYVRCTAQCMATSAVMAALPGGGGLDCFNVVDEARGCLLECLNPFNWGGKEVGARSAKSGGRKGSATTRAQNDSIGAQNEKKGLGTQTGGGNNFPETRLPAPGGGNKGAVYADVTNTASDGTRVFTQNVDTLKNGAMTGRENENALKILERMGNGDRLIIVPKKR